MDSSELNGLERRIKLINNLSEKKSNLPKIINSIKNDINVTSINSLTRKDNSKAKSIYTKINKIKNSNKYRKTGNDKLLKNLESKLSELGFQV